MATPLNLISGMPQVSAAFSGWKSSLVFKRVTQTVESTGFVTDVEENINVRGVWQPMSPEDIQLKPEGQRSWSWFMLHIEGNSRIFNTNDRVVFIGKTYKVMNVKDYSLNNYTQVEMILDYQE